MSESVLGVWLGINAITTTKTSQTADDGDAVDGNPSSSSTTTTSSGCALLDMRDRRRWWQWDARTQLMDSLLRRRGKLRVEVAGSGVLLLGRFYFDQETTVGQLKDAVLVQLGKGLDCSLFFGAKLERELRGAHARLVETVKTAEHNNNYNTAGCVIYASPFKIDERAVLLGLARGKWAFSLSWSPADPLSKMSGVSTNSDDFVCALQLNPYIFKLLGESES